MKKKLLLLLCALLTTTTVVSKGPPKEDKKKPRKPSLFRFDVSEELVDFEDETSNDEQK